MDQNGSPCIRGEGNTKPPPRKSTPRENLGKRWISVWNNPTVSIGSLLESLKPLTTKCIIGDEHAPTTGTHHFQIFFETHKRIRPTEKLRDILPKCHFQPADGNDLNQWVYHTKEKNYVYHGYFPKPIYDHLEHVTPYPFQQYIIDKAKMDCIPTDRTITWIYGNGNLGKTVLGKHLVLKYGFLFVNGKGENILCSIAEYIEKNGYAPRGILYGFPRDTDPLHVSYNSIEVIKDGMFFSPKYKSCMCVFNPPHIFVLCNFYPLTERLTDDRWIIKEVNENKEFN